MTQAVHAEQLKAHERIAEKSEEAVSKLEQTLDRLLARVDRTERRLIVASVVIFASTQKGGEILKVIGGMLQ